jgi:PPOX class probable F420-dependent enzyme
MNSIPRGNDDLRIRPLIGHLAIVRPDRRPAVTPMWFDWDGERLRFTHTTRRAKEGNLEGTPYLVMSGVDPEKAERYLRARAGVESIEPDPGGAFFVTLARRYGRVDPQPPKDVADRVVISARPLAYSKM